MMNPLVLAYVGDTLYDLFVRTQLIRESDASVHELHIRSANKVCAKAQAEAARLVMDKLTEQETAVYKRGRNAHMGTIPKHAEISDYRAATGLEAVLGYLYLSGQDERLFALLSLIFKGEQPCPNPN
jgi:ribonuclease-3 family protein